jgi:hypothetical protein
MTASYLNVEILPINKKMKLPDMVVHSSNSGTWEAKAGRSPA